MDDLIEAMSIFRQYLSDTNSNSPLNCEHDVLWIMDVDPDKVSEKHKTRLKELGFFISEDAFLSYRYGSA